MLSMDEILQQQDTTGQEVERMLINFKKDSAIRKTPKYLEERLNKLEDHWTKFTENHEIILKSTEIDETHAYFSSKFYDGVLTRYNELKKAIIQLQTEQSEKIQMGERLPPTTSAKGPTIQPSQAIDASQPEPDALERLIRRQNAVMKNATHFLEEIESKILEDQPVTYFEYKRDLLLQYTTDIRQLDQQIWELSTTDSPRGYSSNSYHEMEDWLQDAIVALQIRIKAATTNTQSHNSPTTTNHIKLPKINVPAFDGDYLKWIQFRDLFTQVIHNQRLSNAEKMYYLISNLSGEPKQLLQHLSVCDDNYEDAWKLLYDRYENKRLLVTAFLNKFLQQPTILNESAANLKNLHDVTKECILGLKNLKIPVETWDAIIVHLLLKKCDKNTLTQYEQSLKNPRELNTLQNVLTFLQTRFQSLEAFDRKGIDKEKFIKHSSRSSSLTTSINQGQCTMCKQHHPLYTCKMFLSKTPNERYQHLKKNNLCINCMRKGHSAVTCTLRACTKCHKKHNSLVHIEELSRKNNQTNNNYQPETSSNQGTKTDARTSLSIQMYKPQDKYVLLGTVKLRVLSTNGKELQCRAILDSGSQLNFITENLRRKLQLQSTVDHLDINGIGKIKQHTNDRVTIKVQSLINQYSADVEAYVLPKITTHQPSMHINTSSWAIPKNIALADPEFFKPSQVDLLLGAELYHEFLSIGQVKLRSHLPSLQNTVFGWVVSGAINNTRQSQPKAKPMCGICTHEEHKLADQIERFWKLEEPPTQLRNIMSSADLKCETLFNQTTRRIESGRFIVKLLFQQEPSPLGESKEAAFARLRSIEKKFRKDPELKRQYVQFMSEYIQLGHMEELKEIPTNQPHYYLPHHAVMKAESTTTKLRVVFDASAKTTNGKSLNDLLYKGPKIQDELFSILIRFRTPRYVFTADIEKMYRQILMDPTDRIYQLIMWRENEHEPVRHYQLTTVTYGVTTAPYMAIKCLHRLAEQERQKYPLGAASLQEDFYVDDAMVGSDSLIEALEKQEQLDRLLQSAGFKLRKWCANHSKLLERIPVEERAHQLDLQEEDDHHVKTLGMTWLPRSDEFQIVVKQQPSGTTVTKRKVLSEIAHIFDPLGVLSPVIILAKIFMQKLWTLKLDWDAAVPMALHTEWNQFRQRLESLNKIKIPRHISSGKAIQYRQLHVFCDASEKAYGCAAYIRSVLQDGTIIVRLICAKSRVAPTKITTIPRLELCAAKVAAELLQRLKMDLKWQEATFCWTDSEIVLAWINSSSNMYHTFVAHRIASIHEVTTPDQWRYVPSKENPADLLTRGVLPEKFSTCHMWFYGPLYLHAREESWPSQIRVTEPDLEKKRTKTSLLTTETSKYLINHIDHKNSFIHLQRIVAYIMRFINNCQRGSIKKYGPLRTEEIAAALIIVIREIQDQGFKNDITQLKKDKPISNTSSIISLSPFLDDHGLLRVGGRLQEANITYDAKHQILLPYPNDFTKLIFLYYHQANNHVGPQALLALIRQKFWPIKGKTTARSTVQNCVRCAKSRPQLFSQVMGNLPAHRIQPARPFINSGVDFCGPFTIHYKLRGKKPVKCYVAIFCCFATKAVHIEVVSDLTTEAFIGALKRFMSRRGYCKNIYCDNATNFTGAHNQFKELQSIIFENIAQEKISKFCTTKSIEFHFIPPRSPHFGGLWEAAVKSAKTLFSKIIPAASPTYEELETLMIEIEAILNSRPITAMSEDPNDLNALTPGHFLIGEPLTATVDPHAQPVKGNLLYRWKLISHLKQEFWKRWSKEYLCQLQHRYKWNQKRENLKEGMLVVIKEDNAPILSWPLGRIIQVIKGNDGAVRVADIKTARGIIRRAITNLAPLPIDVEDGNDTTISEHTPITESKDTSQPYSFDSKPQTTKRISQSPSASDNTKNTKDGPKGSKRPRYKGPPLFLFIISCLIAPIMVKSEVNVTPFQTHAGLHFENLGTTFLVPKEWNIVVYFDLQRYWQEIDFIQTGLQHLESICDKLTTKQPCDDTMHQINTVLTEIKNSNELLSPRSHERFKRAPLDIIGNIAHSLFGILDSEYANKISDIIENIDENQDQLARLVKNQTSILDSTINILRKFQLTAERQVTEFNEYINQTNKVIDTVQHELQDQRMTEIFNLFSIRLVLMINDYQRIQAALLDVVIDSHHGKINPLLISPSQLQSQLSFIKENLPSELRLPDIRNSMLELYKLMTIEGRATSTHVIFRVRLPLLSTTRYQLLSIKSIPMIMEDNFINILPSTSYIIIDLHREWYYPLSEVELKGCSIIRQNTHYCKQHHPMYKRGSTISECEVNILLQNPITSACKFTISPETPRWTQLNSPNQWMYASKNEFSITIICDDDISHRTIKGSGIITLSKECAIKDDTTTIQGHELYSSSIRTPIISSRNFTELINQQNFSKIISHHLSKNNLTNEIMELKERVHNLPNPKTIRTTTKSDLIHHLSISYTSLIIVLGIIIYLIWKYYTKRGASRTPIPPPRTTRQPPSFNFQMVDLGQANGGEDVEQNIRQS